MADCTENIISAPPPSSSHTPLRHLAGHHGLSRRIMDHVLPDALHRIDSCLASCFFVFPLEGPGSLRGGNARRMGENYKIPLPGPTPEIGEKRPKNCKNCIFGELATLARHLFCINGEKSWR